MALSRLKSTSSSFTTKKEIVYISIYLVIFNETIHLDHRSSSAQFGLSLVQRYRTHVFPSSLSAYHEETIVAQITSLYTLLLRLSYFSPEDVEFPPAGANGHIINEELCRELHLLPEVISLMKKIPYTFDGYQKPLLRESCAFSYLDDQEIRNGRDPENTDTSGDLRMDFLKPWEIALTCWVQTDDGFSIILNTKSNIIQIIDASVENLNDFRDESKAHHAPTYLQGIINDISNLEHIYLPGGDIGIAHPESSEQVQIKRILIEDYGWGTEKFREEDWRREGEEICNRISDEAMEIWEEQKKKLMADSRNLGKT